MSVQHLHEAAEKGKLDRVTALLKRRLWHRLTFRRPEVDARNDVGETALHRAATFRYHTAIIDALLEHGADVNARDQRGRTPLMIAVRCGRLNLKVVKGLLKSGADATLADEAGCTPLEMAEKASDSPELIGLLRRQGRRDAVDSSVEPAVELEGSTPEAEPVKAPPSERSRSVPARRRGGILIWVLRILALAATLVSAYLLAVSLGTASTVGCGGDSGCGQVLASRWSKWLGVPVGGAAVATYGTMFLALLFLGKARSRPTRRSAWSVMIVVLVLAVGAAIWFLILQGLVIRSFCPFCTAVHACGLVIGGFVFLGVITGRSLGAETSLGRGLAMGLAGVGLAGVGILIAGQILVKPDGFRIDQFDGDAVDSTPRFKAPGSSPKPKFDRSIAPPPRSTKFSKPVPKFKAPSNDDGDETSDDPLTKLPLGIDSSPIDPSPTAPTVRRRRTQSSSPRRSPGRKIQRTTTVRQREATKLRPVPELVLPGTAPDPIGADEDAIVLAGGRVRFSADELPILGSTDSGHILAMMFDYTCPHCRVMHGYLAKARKRYQDQLAIALVPSPLDSRCNRFIDKTKSKDAKGCDYSSLAMAVWKAKPSAFEEFDHFLIEGTVPPNLGVARAKAEELVGAEALKKAQADPTVTQLIRFGVNSYGRLNRGAIPKILLPDKVVTGEATSAEKLFSFLEKELNIQPKTAARR